MLLSHDIFEFRLDLQGMHSCAATDLQQVPLTKTRITSQPSGNCMSRVSDVSEASQPKAPDIYALASPELLNEIASARLDTNNIARQQD